jgi:hypothetical protein
VPNWIVHLAAGTLASRWYKPSARVVALFLLGALLPDLASMANVLLLDQVSLPAAWKHFPVWYFQPFHTPFLALFYSLAAALLFSGGWSRNFLNIYGGVVTHFCLDTFQRHLGFHNLTFYPFSMRDLNLNLFYSDHWIFLALTAVSVAVLALAAVFNRKFFLTGGLRIETRRAGWAACLAVAVLAFPFLTRGLFVSSNYHWLQFFEGGDFEGRIVEIGNSKVVSLAPLRTLELGRILELRAPAGLLPAGLRTGDWVSYRGVWRDGGLDVSLFHKNSRYFQKIYLSLAGGLFILWVFVTNLRGGRSHGVRQSRKE